MIKMNDLNISLKLYKQKYNKYKNIIYSMKKHL